MRTTFVVGRAERTLILMDLLQLKRGSVAVCDDRIVVVCAIRRDGKVQVRDLVSARTRFVAASKLSARRLPEVEEKSDKLHHRLVKTNTKQFEEAKRREECVVEALTASGNLADAIEAAAKRHSVTVRTLWRWVSIYRRWPSTEALVLDGRGVRANDRRFDDSTESIIRRATDDAYLTQPKGTYEAVCEEAWRQFDTLNIKRPSRNAIIRRIKALDPWLVARHQLGREEANRKLGAKPGSLKTRRPLALVQIDHTRVDVHVVDDKHRKDIGRPWITVAIDVATRCIMGFYLSLEAPA